MTLRQQGQTFVDIAARYSISPVRVRQIFERARLRITDPETVASLSTRTVNCLKKVGFPETATKDDVRGRWRDLEKGVNSYSKHTIPNFGKRSLDEVRQWLGYTEQPHCATCRCFEHPRQTAGSTNLP